MLEIDLLNGITSVRFVGERVEGVYPPLVEDDPHTGD